MRILFSPQILKDTDIKFHEKSSTGKFPCGQVDGRIDMTTLIDACRNFVKSKNHKEF